MRTRRKVGVFILVGLAVVFLAAGVINRQKYITGEEWFAMQDEYIHQFETFSDDIDSITALYINGDLDADAFREHLDLFCKELDAMEKAYQLATEEHPVQTGTHSYYTKLGCDSVEGCYGVFHELLQMMGDGYQDTDTMGYKYIAYQQKFIDLMSDYMLADYFVNGDGERGQNPSE